MENLFGLRSQTHTLKMITISELYSMDQFLWTKTVQFQNTCRNFIPSYTILLY